MTDIFSTKDRSRIMASVKNRGSKIETRFADILRKRHIGFKQHLSSLPGKPDFAFPRKRMVVFVDSCFWHGCRYHIKLPKSNSQFWKKKIEGNKKRDKAVNKEYKKMKWIVFRLWEHSLTSQTLDEKVRPILTAILKK